jgi:hypothetical protein
LLYKEQYDANDDTNAPKLFVPEHEDDKGKAQYQNE